MPTGEAVATVTKKRSRARALREKCIVEMKRKEAGAKKFRYTETRGERDAEIYRGTRA